MNRGNPHAAVPSTNRDCGYEPAWGGSLTMRGADVEQRIAVRAGPRHKLGAEVAARAGTVVDDHRLSPGLRQLLADNARQYVGRAPRWPRHDDADGLARKSLP